MLSASEELRAVLASTISMSSSWTVCTRAPPKRCLIWREKVAFPHFTRCNHVRFSMNPYFSPEKHSYDRFLGLSSICFMGFFAFFCAEVRCREWSSMAIGYPGSPPPPEPALCSQVIPTTPHHHTPPICTCYVPARPVWPVSPGYTVPAQRQACCARLTGRVVQAARGEGSHRQLRIGYQWDITVHSFQCCAVKQQSKLSS